MKTALLTGIRGQDATYLSKLLLTKGYRVIGTDRRAGGSTYWRIADLDVKGVELVYMDLLEQENINAVIRKYKPDELYNLAAQSFVSVAFEQPLLTTEINAIGVLRLLTAIREYSPYTKFYQASTSEMFGKVQEIPQNEKTPFYPRSPYGVSKLYGHWIAINYRESYRMFNSCGILFNHESPLRGAEFITRKISAGLAAIIAKKQESITVGNINAKRDWGHAADFVDAMWRMLQQEKPDDFVIATGETHSVKEFIEIAFSMMESNITWEGEGVDEIGRDPNGIIRVKISAEFYRPAEVELLIGNASKAKHILGWTPKIKFTELVQEMVKADIDRIKGE